MTKKITIQDTNFVFDVGSLGAGESVSLKGGKKVNTPSLILSFLDSFRTQDSDLATDTAFQRIAPGIYNKNKKITLIFKDNRKVTIGKGLWGFAARVTSPDFPTFTTEAQWDEFVANNPIGGFVEYTLTSSPDTVAAQTFFAPKAYTPGGTDLVNTLQNEDVLRGRTNLGPTSLTGDLGNPNDSGANIIAPDITNVQTINIAFTSTSTGMELDFQDIAGTDTANITRISADLRQRFSNLDADVTDLGIANTNEKARVTITYLNDELEPETLDDGSLQGQAVNLTLNNAKLSGTVDDLIFNGAALEIVATPALGSELQNQIQTYNINTVGSASSIATFATGVTDYDDLVVGELPQTINIDADAAFAVGTLRWLSNRVETNSANPFQAPPANHQVLVNGLGFVNPDQITEINISGDSNVTLANVGDFISDEDGIETQFALDASELTGRLTADISNAVDTVNPAAFIAGGSAADRFYVSSLGEDSPSEDSLFALFDGQNDIRTVLQGNGGIDSLTSQIEGEQDITPGEGSSSIEWLNLVAGRNGFGTTTFNVNMTDGGGVDASGNVAAGVTVFDEVTINNAQIAGGVLVANLFNLEEVGQMISIRSQLTTDAGNTNTLAPAGPVIVDTTSQGDAAEVNVELGSTTDDREESNAFSVKNATNDVTINNPDALDLNVAVNSAAAGAVSLYLSDGEFVSADGTEGTVTITGVATNALNVGTIGSQAYDGTAYAGAQTVVFGTSAQTRQALNGTADDIGLNIATGAAADVINLQAITAPNVAPPATTEATFNNSAFLRNTQIDGNGGRDEVILSANLVDPRVVLVADPTYDGYFENWSNVEDLTFNNTNGIGSVVVAFDAYADAAGLGSLGGQWLTFEDVSASVTAGFRFTPTIGLIGANVNASAADKTTTINNLSANDVTVNIDAGSMTDTGVALTSVQSDLAFTSTGANLNNVVTVNYDNVAEGSVFSLNTASFGSSLLTVAAGSLDTVTFSGAAANNINVTTLDALTASGQTTSYDFSDVDATVPIILTFNASAETDGQLNITSTNDDTFGAGVNASITAGALADTIVSGDWTATIFGGLGSDTITYTGSAVNSSVVVINGGTAVPAAADGNDTITVNDMGAGEILSVTGGSGDDIINIATSTDSIHSINFVGVAGGSNPATTAQIQNSIGKDTITGFSATGTGTFNLEDTTFQGNVDGIASFVGNNLDDTTFESVISSSALLGANIGQNSIVVVQAAANADAQIYYSSAAIAAGVSNVDQLLAAGTLFKIADVSSVTGQIAATDFFVI